ncbi:MAG: heavy metal translocating P-type ATPase [Verrucomicrobiae bacterium]|nr:heavy metal translocating P-type ATPase [Verrucomicrobiae bacterium]
MSAHAASCCASATALPSSEEGDEIAERRELCAQFLLAGICLLTLGLGWLGHRLAVGAPHRLEHAFTIIAYLTGGFYPMLGVIEDLRRLRFNVNFLMVFAALGAACVGAEEEGAVLMFLFSFSGALEQYAGGRTRRAIRSLMKLSPSEATVLRDGKEEVVPVSALHLGDVILVHPGERVAGDGVILDGVSSVDESSLTGESLPVDKRPGNRVLAGSINGHGLLRVKTDREASDTALAKIFRIIEEASHRKAPTERLIERYGGPYTWIVIAATLLTFLGARFFTEMSWGDSLYRAMTLMVVASPCALVLSIPSAVLAAIARGARRGMLFKGGLAIEILGHCRAVAFDKTGTLTLGKPHLTEARYADGLAAADVLADAAAVELNSEHPLAKVIVGEAKSRGLRFERAADSRAWPGLGVEGVVRGETLRVGSEAFVCLHGGMQPWARDTIIEFRSRGLTCLVAARRQPLAVFGVADRLRPGAIRAVSELAHMKIRTVMLTGDHQASAAEFARKLHLSDFRAGLLPDQKVETVRELMEQHGVVAMVGDGVNDAPALVTASVGIAMGAGGSDVAMENADVVLMGDDIERVPEIVRLGRKAQTIIRQNLVFSVGVILALIGATFFAKLKLAFGVVGHEGSTILVVFNSLRLLRGTHASAAHAEG